MLGRMPDRQQTAAVKSLLGFVTPLVSSRIVLGMDLVHLLVGRAWTGNTLITVTRYTFRYFCWLSNCDSFPPTVSKAQQLTINMYSASARSLYVNFYVVLLLDPWKRQNCFWVLSTGLGKHMLPLGSRNSSLLHGSEKWILYNPHVCELNDWRWNLCLCPRYLLEQCKHVLRLTLYSNLSASGMMTSTTWFWVAKMAKQGHWEKPHWWSLLLTSLMKMGC